MLCCHQAVQEQNLLTKTHKCPSWVTSMLATHTPQYVSVASLVTRVWCSASGVAEQPCYPEVPSMLALFLTLCDFFFFFIPSSHGELCLPRLYR